MLRRRPDLAAGDFIDAAFMWPRRVHDDGSTIGAHVNRLDFQYMPARVGSGVGPLPLAGVTCDFVAFAPCGRGIVDRSRERDDEFSGGRADFANTYRQLAVWPQADDVAHIRPSQPSAVMNAADVDIAPRRNGAAQRAEKAGAGVGLRGQAERIHGPLKRVSHALQRESHEKPIVVLATDAMTCERTVPIL